MLLLIMLRERPLISSSWMCKSPNFRQEIRSSYYRNDSLKYDLNVSNNLQNNRLFSSNNRHCFFFFFVSKVLKKTALFENLNFKLIFISFKHLVNSLIIFNRQQYNKLSFLFSFVIPSSI